MTIKNLLINNKPNDFIKSNLKRTPNMQKQLIDGVPVKVKIKINNHNK